MSVMTHLWESTLCAGVAALLALALKDAPARVRHTIWLCASLKFLVPFWPLMTVGTVAGEWMARAAGPTASVAARWLDDSLPRWSITAASAWMAPDFVPSLPHGMVPVLLLVWAAGAIALATWRWRQWRAVSHLSREATPLERGREVAALARVDPAFGTARRMRLLRSRTSLEPALIGIRRPALLWPGGLSQRLSDAQMDAVLAHELCHLRRRDNLASLVHVVVEILFWFHPVVWWVGARLVSERERACDEEVLHMGTNQRQYAEGILKVCEFSLRAPAAFAAGVGGSDLSRRIARILSRRPPAASGVRTRLLLSSVLLLTIGAPVGLGLARANAAGAESPVPTPAAAANGTQDPGDMPRPGDGISWPKLISEVKPIYTPEALQARIQGVVGLEVVVLEDGSVGEVTVVESLDPDYGLDDAAVSALQQWRFEPAIKDGQPVAVLVPVEVSFTLKK